MTLLPGDPDPSSSRFTRTHRRIPWVTLASVGLLVSVHLGADPLVQAVGAISWEGLQHGGWYRLFSAVILHASWGHLAGNLLVLGLLGASLERQLGGAPVLGVLLAAGLSGACGSALLGSAPSLGSSGAVYGLLAAWVLLGGRLREGRLAGRFPPQLWVLLGGLLLMDNLRPQVDWLAHLGGAAGGAGLSWAIRSSWERSLRSPPWLPAFAASLLVLYAAGWGWGSVLYARGGVEAFPDGPYRWVLVNNLAWEAALSEPAGRELERWHDRMLQVVRQAPDQSEFMDTLATLQHRLGRHAEAVALEREVSWLHERPDYVAQFARFAWFARLAQEAPLSPVAVWTVRDPAGERVLRFGPELVGSLEIDALWIVDERPAGLLRVSLGSDTPRELALPEGLLAAAETPHRFEVIEARAARDRGLSLRYWPLEARVFDPEARAAVGDRGASEPSS